jgi:hypothetical protein
MIDQPRSPKYLIDDIAPSREVHLIGGPSGGGKSTWIFQFLIEWSAGRPIYGHASHPVPYVYISTDRGKDSILRTLERLRINPAHIEFVSTITLDLDTVEAIIQRVHLKVPNVRVLFIEGMTGLMPESKGKSSDGGFGHASKFLRHLNKLCSELDITIFAVVHSPKSKEDARYLSPRDRVMGSSAWAAYTETLFLIEPVHADTPSLRNLIIIPRNAPQETHQLEFNDTGRLVESNAEITDTIIEAFLGTIPYGQTFTTEQFTTAMKRAGLSTATITRRLKELTENVVLAKVRQGIYSRVPPS